jgi:hypothetical protein
MSSGSLPSHTSSGGAYGKQQDLVVMILELQRRVTALELALAQCHGITFISDDGIQQKTLYVDSSGNMQWGVKPPT